MSTREQFITGPLGKTPTTLIGCNITTASGSGKYNFAPQYRQDSNLRVVSSGALTAATYKNIISISGSGVLNYLAIYAEDATSRDMYVKITLDGNLVLERSVLTNVTTGAGLTAIGSSHILVNTDSQFQIGADFVPFSNSCVIAIKSSLTETDKISTLYRARTI